MLEKLTYLLGVESRDAYAIAFNFNEFVLTENSKLYFYDEDQTMFLGSFTNQNFITSSALTSKNLFFEFIFKLSLFITSLLKFKRRRFSFIKDTLFLFLS